ncbi:putative PMR5 domain, PC-Esterase [Dioscorea sansibarensis]
MFVGKWTRDFREPIYNNLTCPTLPIVKNCVKHGKDPDYMYWRWKPDGCDLPRFAPSMFLGIVRGKKLAFIGDSLARNHMESLLCLLSQIIVLIVSNHLIEKYSLQYFCNICGKCSNF